MVSSRQDNSYNLTLVNGNGIEMISDTLTTFRPTYNSSEGTMTLDPTQTYPAGGLTPRHFAFNKAGDLVAVPLQDNSALAIIIRDIESGNLTEIVGLHKVPYAPSAVVWDDV
jgi:6-phosphogluconolactonase (cycloisomerase 2 family)